MSDTTVPPDTTPPPDELAAAEPAPVPLDDADEDPLEHGPETALEW